VNPNRILPFFLPLIVLAVSACSSLSGGPLQTESRAIDLAGAESAQIEIRMSAGRLRIESGSQSLLEGAFTYNIQEWRPDITYSVDGEVGKLGIQQPAGIEIQPQRGISVYDWNLRLNPEIPISLSLELGAGEAYLYLGNLLLNDLSITTGSGNTLMDFSGNWQNDLNAKIIGDVGQIDLLLPRQVGIKLETHGIALVSADDLIKEGNIYTNQNYGQSPYNLLITFQAGPGNLNIELE
jgi:hypothetical protein